MNKTDFNQPHAFASLWRRILLLGLVLIPATIASQFMREVLPYGGRTGLELAIIIVFGVLFGWISIGLWTSGIGFLSLLLHRDRYNLVRATGAMRAIDPDARTAILLPVFAEDMARVGAGLRATFESLAETGQQEHFDFFMLSDTQDPNRWVDEEVAWATLCRDLNAHGRIFYRRRHVNLKRKSGNVADFVRRWGAYYRYMVVFDADSVMSGEALVKLVNMMQANDRVGLIQTLPQPMGQHTLFARMLQFTGHAYGPIFAAGLHFWQLGDSPFWGHNAIIRVEAFRQHCALPRLPGRPPLGGDILSHDFVESALLRRGGWTIWLAVGLAGSYEELPPTLLDAMKRDRRWCQGNLQHVRLLFAEGLFPAHRALFINGIMSYVSALLWLVFLLLSSGQAVWQALQPPDYFPAGPALFPQWPVWQPQWAVLLMIATGVILFAPKILAVLLIVIQRRASQFGGISRLLASAFTETLMSALLAPVQAVFHSKFVVFTLLGQQVSWGAQARGDASTGWGEALRYHGFATVVAGAWGLGVFWLSPEFFWWLTPVVGALLLAIPASVLSSRSGVGLRAHGLGLFLTPPETVPEPVLQSFAHQLRRAHTAQAPTWGGFVAAVVDPRVNALHVALQGLGRGQKISPQIGVRRQALGVKLLRDGPGSLGTEEQKLLLRQPRLLLELHRQWWDQGAVPAARDSRDVRATPRPEPQARHDNRTGQGARRAPDALPDAPAR
ncbi:MAG: glucans biosynthesis glucosyltransferase MdoH [Immundisolibacter sp.]|uniref:glucans biosynthesis glucosyltransferase MdoH n=1 Tax=Immundisolibacter sp. TaxID=1934948 RepID=UPI003EDEF308